MTLGSAWHQYSEQLLTGDFYHSLSSEVVAMESLKRETMIGE